MELATQITNNQRAGLLKKNEQLIKIKLKELVFDYTDEVIEVMHKTGIAASAVLPNDVLLTIVIKQLSKNAAFREVISKMLLELDGHYGADGDGTGLATIGGALSAVGNVLASIGRGNFQNSDGQQQQQQLLIQQQQQMQMEQDRKRRTTFIVVGISIGLLVVALFIFKTIKKTSPQVQISAT